MVKVTTQCFNPHRSSPVNTWRSHPNMIGTKIAAMNFLVCFSVLVSGASPVGQVVHTAGFRRLGSA